jgi:long-chain acyl-CoA synthetase
VEKDNSLIKSIEDVFRSGWDMPALTDLGSDVTYSYGDVATRVCYIHCMFEVLGIKSGDKIAICDKNSTNWAISMLAIITYRSIAVPLLPDYSRQQLKMLCEHCDAKFMMGNRQLATLWEEGECPMYMLDTEDLLTMTPNTATDKVEEDVFSIFKTKYPNGYSKEDVHYEAENPDDLMLLSYTSGSTGNPKGVMLSWQAMVSNMEFAYHALPVEPGYSELLLLPMAHMFGFAFDFLYGIMRKAHLFIFTRIPAPKMILEAFDKVKPGQFLCVPLVMEKIINNKVLPVLNKPIIKLLFKVPGLRQLICRKIRQQLTAALGGNFYEVIMGGAALSKEVERILRMVGFRYTIGYGMTECGPIITYSDWKEHRPGSCGKAALNMEVKILSEDPFNIPGEIVTKGKNVMMGYYKNPEATADTIDKDGWLHTGDLGVIDKDGFIYIRGRKKNMLLGANGQNIYPEEAEDQVVTHSIFDECVVVQRNDKLVALVYVSDLTLKIYGKQREQLDLEAIRKEVNDHLPRYCQLAGMEQRYEEFEKTPKKSIRRFLYK